MNTHVDPSLKVVLMLQHSALLLSFHATAAPEPEVCCCQMNMVQAGWLAQQDTYVANT
jgi:hypothetical protein